MDNLWLCQLYRYGYLLAHNGAAAAAEYQKLLDHRGIVVNFVTGSLAHLQIGRAYPLQNDTDKARIAYQDFFTIWKDADHDVPVFKESKVEYASCLSCRVDKKWPEFEARSDSQPLWIR